MTTATASVQEAIRYLAGRCDWASTRDDAGFSGVDTGLGHFLAALPDDQWTPAQLYEGWQLTRKYRRQLDEAGFDLDAMAEPERPEGNDKDIREKAQTDRVKQKRGEIKVKDGEVVTISDRRLELKDGQFVLAFKYDSAMVDAARTIEGRAYHGPSKTNRYPLTPGAAWGLKDFFDRFDGFEIEDDAAEKLAELATGDAPAWGTITLEPEAFIVTFPYERDVVGALQRVQGRRWDGRRKVNTVPREATAGEQLTAFLADHRERGWDVSDEATAEMEALCALVQEQREAAGKLKKLSVAEDATLDIPGLGGELRPFQKAGVKYALKTRRTFIADDMGTGKTVQALAAALATDSFPMIVVCPQTMKLAWRKHVVGPTPGAPNGWLPGKKVRILSGRKPNARLLAGADVIIINYDVLAPWVGTLKALRPQALVLDESHYVKSSKAQRTKASKALAKIIPATGLVLLLTGTANKNRPIEFTSQLDIMGRLGEFGGYMEFAKRYCGAFHDGYGWNVSGATNLKELNDKLRASCYIRRRKSDIMKELPPKQIATVPVELSNRKEYDRVEADVIAWLRENAVEDEEFLQEISGLSDEEQREAKRRRAGEAAARAERAERLVQINKLRLIAGQGKIKAAGEWIEDFLGDGDEKLVVFADHIEVQKALLSAARKHKPVHVLGEDKAEDRQEAVRKFQEDPATRLIVCSIKAAGVGITLTAATNVLMVESAWTPSDMDQAEDRLHRMGQEGQVTVWNMIAEDSFDEDMAAMISEKRAVVTAATDGRKDASRVSVMADAINRLLKKR